MARNQLGESVGMRNGGIAPDPTFAERTGNVYERKMAPGVPGNRGPLRFEEGIATDTDVPTDFQKGMMQGLVTAPGRPNHNANVYEKYPEETMAQRAHVGSAAWVESTSFLGEFAQGSFTDYAEPSYLQVTRNGAHYERRNPAVVTD
jgi:hypothetical protein